MEPWLIGAFLVVRILVFRSDQSDTPAISNAAVLNLLRNIDPTCVDNEVFERALAAHDALLQTIALQRVEYLAVLRCQTEFPGVGNPARRAVLQMRCAPRPALRCAD